ncbi:MAG: hypothetical protein LBH68_05095, partial [Bifidobacteriaceae bacterium]|nr:hypothetical protein [Bifidobacteriaceae bacterium]
MPVEVSGGAASAGPWVGVGVRDICWAEGRLRGVLADGVRGRWQSGDMRDLVGFDTETTGVRTEADRIVTAALVCRRADGSREAATWLINPGVEIPAQATAVHGITTAKAQA